ncbi:hypothetical protein MNBD_NITROSPINAE02-1121 [hydrothermal vent metagenome]|uniref:Outer membrane lipoprotein BamD-like domain-containing protein n=1 Tax=hydrothermal vent metagenome TaxID=652676 RepID=A0A3B1C5H0_9ZZZZ
MSSHNMSRNYIAPSSFQIFRFFSLTIVSMALISGLGACVASDKQEIALMQTQVTRIDERVATIHKSVKIQANMVANVDQLQRSVMALDGQMEELNLRSGKLMEKLERLELMIADLAREARKRKGSSGAVSPDYGPRLGKMERELVKLSRETATLSSLVREQGKSPIVVAPPKPIPVENRLEPGELYQLSYNSFLRGDFDAAMSGFGRYLDLYPKTDLSDNAAYWIGAAHYGKKEYTLAAKAFDKMAKDYPTSNKAPTALLKSSEALMKVDDKGAAVERLKMLVDKYTNSNEAITALDRLSSMSVRYPAE